VVSLLFSGVLVSGVCVRAVLFLHAHTPETILPYYHSCVLMTDIYLTISLKSACLTFCARTISVGLCRRPIVVHLQGETYHVHCYVSYVGCIVNYSTTLDNCYWFMTVEK